MKNWTTSAAALGLGALLASPAMASETRINSLSAGGATFGDLTTSGNPVFNEKLVTVQDNANLLYLPQYFVKYKNSVQVDNTSGPTYGTMNVQIGRAHV